MQRLKTRPQFQAVLAGSIVAKTEHFALHRNRLDVAPRRVKPESTSAVADREAPVSESLMPALFPVQDVWIGAMVPKRWAKRAVTRNAIKRQVYIVSALALYGCPKAAFLVRLRKAFSRKEFLSATSEQLKQAVRVEVQALMQAGTVTK